MVVVVVAVVEGVVHLVVVHIVVDHLCPVVVDLIVVVVIAGLFDGGRCPPGPP